MTYPLQREAHTWQELKRRLLASMPELAEDDETLFDTLDGLTELTDQIGALLRSANEQTADAEGIKAYVAQLTERKKRLEATAGKKRAIAQNFMRDCGIAKLSLPDFTASVRAVPPGVVIFSAESLPDEFVKIERVPDKAAIKKALKEGRQIPGAQLDNGGETLSIRRT